MEKIFNLENTDLDLKTFLYEKLRNRRDGYLRKVLVKYANDKSKLFDVQQQIEHDFNHDLEKLDELDSILKDNTGGQKKFVEMMKYMDDYEEPNIIKENLLDGILSYGIILKKMPSLIISLSDEDAYLIASSMTSFDDLSIYDIYVELLSNPTLLNVMREKTTDISIKRNMIYKMFDTLYDIDYEGLDEFEYLNAVKKCLSIVNNYKIKDLQINR